MRCVGTPKSPNKMCRQILVLDVQHNLRAFTGNIECIISIFLLFVLRIVFNTSWAFSIIILAIFLVSGPENWDIIIGCFFIRRLCFSSLVGFILVFVVCNWFSSFYILFFFATLSSFFVCFFFASIISCLCGDAVTIIAFPRLVEVEGASIVGTGCTSAGTINGTEGDISGSDNGIVGLSIVEREGGETAFTNCVVLFSSVEEGGCGKSSKMFSLSGNIPVLRNQFIAVSILQAFE